MPLIFPTLCKLQWDWKVKPISQKSKSLTRLPLAHDAASGPARCYSPPGSSSCPQPKQKIVNRYVSYENAKLFLFKNISSKIGGQKVLFDMETSREQYCKNLLELLLNLGLYWDRGLDYGLEQGLTKSQENIKMIRSFCPKKPSICHLGV